jgi:hypothetical protein
MVSNIEESDEATTATELSAVPGVNSCGAICLEDDTNEWSKRIRMQSRKYCRLIWFLRNKP